MGGRHTGRHTDGGGGRHTGRHTDRGGRHTGRHTDRGGRHTGAETTYSTTFDDCIHIVTKISTVCLEDLISESTIHILCRQVVIMH